jgi:hypothetical protein
MRIFDGKTQVATHERVIARGGEPRSAGSSHEPVLRLILARLW